MTYHSFRRSQRLRKKLRLEPLESRRLLAVVTWDGGGDAVNWTDPLNWDLDRLPGESDDVVIGELSDNTSAVIVSRNQTVRSVQLSASISVGYGSLTLTGGDSSIDGQLDGMMGVLAVTGPSTHLIVSEQLIGQSSLNLSVREGATAEFPNLTEWQGDEVLADGEGSVVSMPQLQRSGRAEYRALNGGHVALPQVGDCGSSLIDARNGSSIFLGTNVPRTVNCANVGVWDSLVRTGVLEAVGAVSGNGTLDGDVHVRSSSFASDGLSVAGLHIMGNLETAAETNWVVKLAEGQAAPISVDGDVSIAGNFRASVVTGSVPEVGDFTQVVTANAINGQFQSVAIAADNTGVRFEASYESQSVTMKAVPDIPLRVIDTSIHQTAHALSHIFVEFNQPVNGISGGLYVNQDDSLRSLSYEPRSVSPTKVRFESGRYRPIGTLAGDYVFRVESRSENANGNRIDQDGDGIRGEEFDDVYSERIVVSDNQGPRVIGVVDNPHKSNTSRFVDVVFSEPIDRSSFDSKDVIVVDSEGNAFEGTPYSTGPSILSPFTGESSFARYVIEVSQGAVLEGAFTIQIGPDVQDANGLSMDQNGDGILGASGDTFVGTVSSTMAQPVPTFDGNGATVELFYGADIIPFDHAAPTPGRFQGLVPDASMLATEIDFPVFGGEVRAGSANLSDFFSTKASLPDAISWLPAVNFMLRNTFSIPITTELDLDTATSEIDIRFHVTSDDGYHLVINDVFLGSEDDRALATSTFDLTFPSEGLYPVELLYIANHGGYSGLDVRWTTASESGIIGREFMYAGSTPLMPGDANADGRVDSIDLGRLLNRFHDEGTSWRDGDFDDDGFIGSIDLGLLLNRFGDVTEQAETQQNSSDAVFASSGFLMANGSIGESATPASDGTVRFDLLGLEDESDEEREEERNVTWHQWS